MLIRHPDVPETWGTPGGGPVSAAGDEEVLEARWFEEPLTEDVSELLERVTVERTTNE